MSDIDPMGLKTGDELLVKAVILSTDYSVPTVPHVHVAFSNNTSVLIEATDIVKVAKFSLSVGDSVRWWDKGWNFGTILALEEDQEPTAKAQGRVWAWVKEDTRWPRRTFDLKDLSRA